MKEHITKLTNKEVKEYWTQDLHEIINDDIFIPNDLYLALNRVFLNWDSVTREWDKLIDIEKI